MEENLMIDEGFMDIDGEVLLELSLSNLRNNVRREFGPEREQRSNRVGITNYQVIPSVQDKTILIKAKVVGEEKNYDVQVRFINAIFAQELRPDFTEIKAMDGQTYFIRKFTSAQTQAKVRCSCLDFYYRFSLWNHNRKSLEGDPPPPYIKKTDRAPANPNKVPGSCKHIIKFITFLRTEGIVR